MQDDHDDGRASAQAQDDHDDGRASAPEGQTAMRAGTHDDSSDADSNIVTSRKSRLYPTHHSDDDVAAESSKPPPKPEDTPEFWKQKYKDLQEQQQRDKRERLALAKQTFRKQKKTESVISEKRKKKIAKYHKILRQACADGEGATDDSVSLTSSTETEDIPDHAAEPEAVVAEVVEEAEGANMPPWSRIVKITGWEYHNKAHDHPGLYLDCDYADGMGGGCSIGEMWEDFPKMLTEYIKKNKLKGKRWERGGGDTEEIKRILDHSNGGKHRTVKVLWNNGLVEWARYDDVHADYPIMVNEYFGDE